MDRKMQVNTIICSVVGEKYTSYVPAPLPPKPPIKFSVGRAAGSARRVHSALQESPMSSVAKLSSKTGLSAPAVTNALNNLERLGIINEITGRSYGRVYAYSKYIAILGEGTEPPKN